MDGRWPRAGLLACLASVALAGIRGRAAGLGVGSARDLGRVSAAGHGRGGRGQGQDGGTGRQRPAHGHAHAVNGIQGPAVTVPRSRMGALRRRAGRPRQVQMFSLAVLGAKLEAGCGVVRGPALAVLP